MVMGTVLPFSTSGATSRSTLPACTGAPPAKRAIAAINSSGVADAGRDTTPTAMLAPRPAALRSIRRRLGFIGRSLAQGLQERHHVLDLLRRQHRQAPPRATHAREPVAAVVG